MYPALTYDLLMLTFGETPLFSRLVYDYLSDDEYAALHAQLAEYPRLALLCQSPLAFVRFGGLPQVAESEAASG